MVSSRQSVAEQTSARYSRASTLLATFAAVLTVVLTMAFIVLVGVGGLMLLWASGR